MQKKATGNTTDQHTPILKDEMATGNTTDHHTPIVTDTTASRCRISDRVTIDLVSDSDTSEDEDLFAGLNSKTSIVKTEPSSSIKYEEMDMI
jgi:hypothetical protein